MRSIFCCFTGYNTSHTLDPELERLVLLHIDSIPRANHYRRNHAPLREYISVNGISSIADTYRLYVRWMSDRHESEEAPNYEKLLASQQTYRYIATTRRNIGFSKYGEKCETCSIFETLQLTNSDAYKRHRKIEAEARKQHQHFSTREIPGLQFAVADKGSVKLIPKLNVDFSYYLQRLSLIPMTIHSLPSHDSITYWWTEEQGGRGVSNILTIINMYIASLPPETRNLRLHFDNCGGENKSQYTCTYQFPK